MTRFVLYILQVKLTNASQSVHFHAQLNCATVSA